MKPIAFFAICSMAALSACGGSSVKETLGISRKPPDEYRVVARPPLSVPPQFNLRPPSVSEESPTVVPTDKQAQSIILGTPASDGNTFSLKEGASQTAVTPVTEAPLKGASNIDGVTNSESQFLKNIGADKADPNVRESLIEKKIEAQEKKENAPWWQFYSPPDKKEAVVDAKKEAERIRTNKDTGKPVTEGETPDAKERDRGILGQWFGW